MSVQNWAGGSRAFSAALTLTVAVGLFAYGGYWLDGVAGTTPLFLVVGVALGAAGGFIHLLNALAPELLPWSKASRRRGERTGNGPSAAGATPDPLADQPPPDQPPPDDRDQ